METVIRNVADIAPPDRQAIEHVLGHPLSDSQQVIIQVATLNSAPVDAMHQPTGAQKLPEWCNVYDGLSDEQIADVESVILQRADLTRFPE